MKYFAQILLFGGLLFFHFASGVFAATSVSITNVPGEIDKEQEVEIDVLLTCSGCSSDSYIRGVFYPSGTSYFGFTQNKEGVWTNASGSGCTGYYKIVPSELSEGSWSGKLKVKPDTTSTYYAGIGEYLFKVGRYTPSCNSPTWSQEVTVAITGPTPTLTPTPSPVPTSASVVMNSQTHTNSPTPTKKPTPTSTPPDSGDSSGSADSTFDGVILGDTITMAENSPRGSSVSGSPLRVFGIAAAFVGAGLALLSGVLVWQKRNTRKT